MGYKIVVNEYSNLQGLNSTKVLVSEYAAIGSKTTKVIVVEDTNIGTSAYNAAIQAAAEAKVSADAAAQSAADTAAALGTKVSKAGDTMTGNLTVPKVLLSTSQGAEVNAAVRKDHLDTQLALKADKTYTDTQLALKLNLTGGTLTGNLTTPKVLLSSTQGTEVNALTRKDYVDAEIAKQVSRTGDTMTGNLTTTGVLRGQLYHDKGYFNFGAYGTSYGDGRLQGYFREYNNGTPGVGYLGLLLEHRDGSGAATGKQVDISLNGKFVYHEGRKPTASDVGALAVGDNAVSATKLQTARTINGVAFDGTANISLTPANIGALPSGSNAVSATKLLTARKIAGVNFDGTADITLDASNVGALDLTGGTITGSLQILNSSLAAPIILNRKSQVGLQFVIDAALNSRYLGVDTTGVLRFGTNLDHSQNNQVFHEGNKQPNLPTTGEFDTSYAFKQTGISQFFTSSNNTSVPNGLAGAGFHVLRNTTAGTTTSDAAMTFFSPNNGQNQLYFRNAFGGGSGWAASHGFSTVMLSKGLGTEDLNTLSSVYDHGFYYQGLSANATPARNYPSGEAGTLYVVGGPYGAQQEYTTFSSARKFARGLSSNGVWMPWRELGAYGAISTAALNSGWTSYGSGYGPAEYVKNGNIVTLSGLIVKAAGVANIAFTLPAGYRPPYRKIFVVQSSTGTYRADVQADGVVSIDVTTATAITWVSLDGIVFYSDR
ncbi:pyocin knob domain-containing protein [Aeromonas sanarellii]